MICKKIEFLNESKSKGNRMSEYDQYLMKICIILPNELRTSFITRFTERQFTTDYFPSIGVDITTKQIKVDNTHVKLILVVTTGEEFSGKLRASFFKGGSAVIIFFDKGDRQSFDVIEDWIKEFRKNFPKQRVPIGFVGFITDTEEITTNEGEGLVKQINMKYYETTPKDNKKVEHIMIDLSKAVIIRPIKQTFAISAGEMSDLIKSLDLEIKKISILEYWGELTVGYCRYQCDKVPKSFLISYEKAQKFIKYPEQHISQCVNSCPLFNLIVDRKLAQAIIGHLYEN